MRSDWPSSGVTVDVPGAEVIVVAVAVGDVVGGGVVVGGCVGGGSGSGGSPVASDLAGQSGMTS